MDIHQSKQTPNLALALGGGGARGYAHLGVLQVLQDNNIPVDLIVGTSMGAIVGAIYADTLDAEQARETMLAVKLGDALDYAVRKFYKGVMKGDKLEENILKIVKARQFHELKMPFVSVATDLTTGDSVAITEGNLAKAVRASSSLPPFFPTVKWGTQTLVDGGAAAIVPVEVARTYKPKCLIAVNVAPKVTPKSPKTALGNFLRYDYHRIWHMGRLMTNLADVAVYPKVGDTGVFDDSQKEKLVIAGRRAMEAKLDEVLKILGGVAASQNSPDKIV